MYTVGDVRGRFRIFYFELFESRSTTYPYSRFLVFKSFRDIRTVRLRVSFEVN